jgi:hypothetical protein
MDDKGNKDKSLDRNKRTLISLGDVLIQGGAAAAGTPALGAVYKLIRVLASHVKAYYNDRRDERIVDFHEQVLEGVPVDQQEDFLKAEFSVEDYYSILEKAVQDEESSKVAIYAKLFRCLILDLIPKDYKLHLLKTSRELNYSDFELMRQLYINDKYEFRAPGNKLSQITNLTKPADPLKAYAVQKLIRLGFLNEREQYKPPWPNDLLKLTVDLLYDKDSLTPEALGQKAKPAEFELLRVFVACNDLEGPNTGVLLEINNRLNNSYIKTIVGNPTRKSFPLTIVPMIALCVGTKGSPLDNLRAFTNLDKKTVVQVLLPGATHTSLPLTNAETFDLSNGGGAELERFVNFVLERFGEGSSNSSKA